MYISGQNLGRTNALEELPMLLAELAATEPSGAPHTAIATTSTS